MKRLLAIILLCVHLFYIGGYSVLFAYYIHKADVQMVKQVFDNKIDDNKNLIEIKIAVRSSAYSNSDEYEMVSGQIQLKNAFYNYVRLKVTQDTMYFVCLPNVAKTRLVNANIVTAKEISDVPISKNSHSPSVKKVISLSEYNIQSFVYNYAAVGTFVKLTKMPVTHKLVAPFIESPGKPPNFTS